MIKVYTAIFSSKYRLGLFLCGLLVSSASFSQLYLLSERSNFRSYDYTTRSDFWDGTFHVDLKANKTNGGTSFKIFKGGNSTYLFKNDDKKENLEFYRAESIGFGTAQHWYKVESVQEISSTSQSGIKNDVDLTTFSSNQILNISNKLHVKGVETQRRWGLFIPGPTFTIASSDDTYDVVNIQVTIEDPSWLDASGNPTTDIIRYKAFGSGNRVCKSSSDMDAKAYFNSTPGMTFILYSSQDLQDINSWRNKINTEPFDIWSIGTYISNITSY